jgi:hypothetical protein
MAHDPGYSGTPLARKLGYVTETGAVVIGAPVPYAGLLGVNAAPAVLAPDAAVPAGTAFLHVFTASRTELDHVLTSARHRIASDGVVWVSWPKKSSKVPTDITEDTIRDIALPLGFVDVKVCAVTEVWSGLKLVIRKTLR